MAQNRKTPKYLVALINKHSNLCDWTDERIRVKTKVPVENQMDHVREGTPEQWIANVNGFAMALEEALMAYGCYAGFMYMGKTQHMPDGSKSARGHLPLTDPDFAEWRRLYFTNGSA